MFCLFVFGLQLQQGIQGTKYAQPPSENAPYSVRISQGTIHNGYIITPTGFQAVPESSFC